MCGRGRALSKRRTRPLGDLQKLLEIIDDIARGNYSNDIMPLTADAQPEPIRSIAEAMGMMMVRVEAREYRLQMLVQELEELNREIKENTIKMVSTMANALGARDEYTEGHTLRVSELAVLMARYMGLDQETIEYIRIGGVLHDIGKIGFSDRLFQAQGARNPPDLMKEIVKHPTAGARILKDLDFLGPAIDYVHCHHERPDGKGYPRRLKGEDVPLGAKILAVADAYDAITTDRPYQKGRTPNQAMEILNSHAGTSWDADCVAALEAVLSAGGEIGRDSEHRAE
ncbi:MAG: HD domain-containing protein [Deltaproteobacteria bacterium]|nr:HD domain-containing protein [Deltaproteobacteria bacterium]